MKCGKSGQVDSLSAEHLKHADARVFQLLNLPIRALKPGVGLVVSVAGLGP